MKYLVRLVAAAVVALPSAASADVTHTVGRGHTVEAIAHRYHVAVKAILDANHLKDGRHLKVGQQLVIPGVNPPAAPTASSKPGTKPAAHVTVAAAAPARPLRPAPPPTYAARPKTPGVIHLKRLATTEEVSVRVSDRRGRLSPPTLHTMERVLRYPNGQTHPIDARLVSLLGVVSNHFGSRTIEVISGFRPYSPTQYTKHSNHNVGHAVDFRVVGVPNEVVRDFCRTLRNTGCGYYPNSVFVHMDTRDSSAFWIDYSKPGEPPRYNANPASPAEQPDEGASDVGDEAHLAAPADGAVPAPAPSADTPAAPPTPAPPGAPPGGTPASSPAPQVDGPDAKGSAVTSPKNQ